MKSEWEEARLLACYEQMGLLTDVHGHVVSRQWNDYRCIVCGGTIAERVGETLARFKHAHWHLTVEGDDGPLANHLRTPDAGISGGAGSHGGARGLGAFHRDMG